MRIIVSKNIIIKTFGVISVILALAGCEFLQLQYSPTDDDKAESSKAKKLPSPKSVTTVTRATDSEVVVTLLRYSRFISELNEEELNAEFKKIEDANNTEKTSRGMLKLAVLLSMPASKFRDDERAEKLLESFVDNNKRNKPALREYAHMLLSNLRQRLSFQKMYEDLHGKLQKERMERKQLQSQLDALKSIEKSITKRQKDVGVAKP